ncbi:MAG: prepilin-type N-terminal cleavage/methylation domain-containing protein, partial [Kiritimatiellae bacterium]|nr:prepilin-type N-terminal cleavage/methylation domain-containing protein [Kiritimatiellia bacterium]
MKCLGILYDRLVGRMTGRKVIFTRRGGKRGFTLVELMVSSGLMTIVMAGFVAGFLQHRRVHHQKNIEQELQQNMRTAWTFLQRDLRYAGSGMGMGGGNIQNWFSYADKREYGVPVNMARVPLIVDGGDGSDELFVIGVSGEPVATLRELAFFFYVYLSLEIYTG